MLNQKQEEALAINSRKKVLVKLRNKDQTFLDRSFEFEIQPKDRVYQLQKQIRKQYKAPKNTEIRLFIDDAFVVNPQDYICDLAQKYQKDKNYLFISFSKNEVYGQLINYK